jgi:hypothetical protein
MRLFSGPFTRAELLHGVEVVVQLILVYLAFTKR